MAVGLGATAYLSSENQAAGAFLFSVGLFMIYTFGFYLFTGKVCDLPGCRPRYLLYLSVVLAGNAVGAYGTACLLNLTRLSHLAKKAAEISAAKLDQSLPGAFILSLLCGVLMCVAVKGFTGIREGIGKYFALIVPIMVFIVAGFEHSIANIFYFTLASAWSLRTVGYLAVFVLGNAAGGIAIPLLTLICGPDTCPPKEPIASEANSPQEAE